MLSQQEVYWKQLEANVTHELTMYQIKSSRIAVRCENAVVANATGNMDNMYQHCGLTRISPSLVIASLI